MRGVHWTDARDDHSNARKLANAIAKNRRFEFSGNADQ